jgi:Na+-translocating ferredoxin:NAD+ oxidoreductase RnfG subunit
MRSRILAVAASLLCVISTAGAAHAAQLMTVDEALKSVFGGTYEIQSEVKTLTATELAKIEGTLDRPLLSEEERKAWDFPVGSAADSVAAGAAAEAKKELTFYFAVKDGKRQAVAVVVDVPGKWGMVDYMIGMDLGGVVKRVEMIAGSEKRGRDVARRSFMKQFEGKTVGDGLEVAKDITAVSGATVTSRSATSAVRIALVLYKAFYLSGQDEGSVPAKAKEEGAAMKASQEKVPVETQQEGTSD